MTALRSQVAALRRLLHAQAGRRLPATAAAYLEHFPDAAPPVLARTAPLRPYQAQVARAVLESVRAGAGLSFSVMVSRQGGKNELSAQLELALLLRNRLRNVDAVKTAPTLTPQLAVSLRRLMARAQEVAAPARLDAGYAVTVGRARLVALSAEPAANVVGHTAGLLLEVDEAQDVEPDKFDKDFRPMAATTNATTVYYGTAWTDTDLLAAVKAHHLELERRDGVKRHYEFDWQEVARHNRTYGAFVERERERLGADSPMFTTQYLLQPLAGGGRLLTEEQRANLLGMHPRYHDRPTRASTPADTLGFVAGLDLGGDALAAGGEPDYTVLTIARVRAPLPDGPRLPRVELLELYAWQGVAEATIVGEVGRLCWSLWNVSKLVIDATGKGAGIAAALARAHQEHPDQVERLWISERVKSELGLSLIAAASAGRLKLWQADGSSEYLMLVDQLRLARREFKPNRMMSWSVAEQDGHDDHLFSLALALHAAAGFVPRTARGRSGE